MIIGISKAETAKNITDVKTKFFVLSLTLVATNAPKTDKNGSARERAIDPLSLSAYFSFKTDGIQVERPSLTRLFITAKTPRNTSVIIAFRFSAE